MSAREIAPFAGIAYQNVLKWLKKWNVPLRTGSEAVKTQWENNPKRRKQASDIMSKITTSGKDHPRWKGGIEIRSDGYILEYSPEHPNAHKGKVRQHRLVVERDLGRYLEAWEHVHHINGIKTDNRIENLRVMSISEHTKLHHHDNTGAFA